MRRDKPTFQQVEMSSTEDKDISRNERERSKDADFDSIDSYAALALHAVALSGQMVAVESSRHVATATVW
jgi:hypothetical protein